jgi:agmatinase
MPEPEMTPAMYGPDITFAGVQRATLSSLSEGDGYDVVFVGAPFDGGTTNRPGTRFGPQAIRGTDYLPQDGSRPHLALGVDPLTELRWPTSGTCSCRQGTLRSPSSGWKTSCTRFPPPGRCR